MDFNKLKAFVCVVQWGSFTRASAELFISQPALSKKISDFENEIGTPLLVRGNRIIELTPAGKLLYSEAPAFLKIGDDLERKVREVGMRPGSQLSIGCSGIEYGRLFPIMAGFQKAYPDIGITMHRFTADEITRQLQTNMLDVVFQTHFEVEHEPEVDSILFCRDELALVVGHDHPLADAEEVEMAQIQNETYIGIQPRQDHLPFSRMLSNLCEHGYEPKEVRVASSVEELLLWVSCGLGIAHLFRQTEAANRGMVRYIRCKPRLELEIDTVWKKNNKNPAVARLVDYIRRENEKQDIR